jgi:hypothetical protein
VSVFLLFFWTIHAAIVLKNKTRHGGNLVFSFLRISRRRKRFLRNRRILEGCERSGRLEANLSLRWQFNCIGKLIDGTKSRMALDEARGSCATRFQLRGIRTAIRFCVAERDVAMESQHGFQRDGL